MNRFAALFNKATYRTARSTPVRADGLHVTGRWWGGRTVHHPDVPAFLEARRRRVLLEGLDSVDAALMDADTAALLRATFDRMVAEQLAASPGVPGWVALSPSHDGAVVPGSHRPNNRDTVPTAAFPWHPATSARLRA